MGYRSDSIAVSRDMGPLSLWVGAFLNMIPGTYMSNLTLFDGNDGCETKGICSKGSSIVTLPSSHRAPPTFPVKPPSYQAVLQGGPFMGVQVLRWKRLIWLHEKKGRENRKN